MKQLTLNGREVLAVNVPDYSTGFDLDYNSYALICLGEYVDAAYIVLPSGQWEILGRPSEITEEVARGLVDNWESVYKDGTIIYQRYPDEIPKCRTATESLLSWCKSNNITNQLLLIKK